MSPFLSVWLHPRETIREIVATNPRLYVVWLAAGMGIVNALDKASEKNLGDKYPLSVVLLTVLIIGPLGGILSLWIWGWLARVTGGWLGGHADSVALRAAGAWSSVPQISILILWIPLVLILGEGLFQEETDRLDDQLVLSIVVIGIAFLAIVAAIWGFVIACKMVAEVQGFESAWKGLLNIFLSGAVVIVPLILIGTTLFLLLGS